MSGGQQIREFGAPVIFRPRSEMSGQDFDHFSYSVHPVGWPNLRSRSTNVTINVVGMDDMPTVAPYHASTPEDVPVPVELVAMDPDMPVDDGAALHVLDVHIDQLPSHGQLFLEAPDGSMSQVRLDEPYSPWRVSGDVIEQYVTHIVAVSSFWGSPPYVGYHPLNVIGPPDVSAEISNPIL